MNAHDERAWPEQLVFAMNRERSIDERFQRFHEANPHVYDELRKLAYRARRAGARRIGVKMLFEVLRWRHTLRTQGDDFKLNNNYHSRYARLLMQEPGLEDCFETRSLSSHYGRNAR
jgi:hypothetical protein